MATAETLTTQWSLTGSTESRMRQLQGASGAVMNPATGEQIAEVGFASAADVDRAVAAAKAAAHDWRATPLSRRAEILFRFRDLIVAASQRARRDHQPRERQDHGRCAGRSGARA